MEVSDLLEPEYSDILETQTNTGGSTMKITALAAALVMASVSAQELALLERSSPPSLLPFVTVAKTVSPQTTSAVQLDAKSILRRIVGLDQPTPPSFRPQLFEDPIRLTLTPVMWDYMDLETVQVNTKFAQDHFVWDLFAPKHPQLSAGPFILSRYPTSIAGMGRDTYAVGLSLRFYFK